jgi:glycosyltransferase involved in cell wall biosynthesis
MFDRSEPQPLPAGTVHFLHVANLTEVKDQRTLLRAFAHIAARRDSRLRIVGGDYLNGEIQREAEVLGIGEIVEFLGFVPHELLPEHYQWAHMLLQTSLHEAGGVVIAEAASSNVVICGTATGILHDLRCDAAVAVGPGDAEGLVREVLSLLADPDRFAALQKKAQAWARANTVVTAAQTIAETYEFLITG